jgi:hypothetical protein
LGSTHDAVERLVDSLGAQRAELVDEGVRAIRSAITAYERIEDPAFVANVRSHFDGHHTAILRSIQQGRAVGREELLFVRPHATRRVGQVPLVDFIQSFRVYEAVLWRAALAFATDRETRDAALAVVQIIMDYHHLAATHASEVYVEAERLLRAQGEQARRDLLEDLLAGRPPAPGSMLAAAREAGLDTSTRCLVIVALPIASAHDEHVLRAAAAALVRSTAASVRPLTAVRGEEIVIVAPCEGDPPRLAHALGAAHRRLASQGVQLAVGVSTIQERLEGLPLGYREALSALERVRRRGGVVALPVLRAFDYLTRFGHETVGRLVPAAIRRFVKEDLADGGVLTATLLE